MKSGGQEVKCQEVRGSGGQKVRRSEVQDVRRSRGQEVRRSGSQEVKRSWDVKGVKHRSRSRESKS